jgi:hypothetical protein
MTAMDERRLSELFAQAADDAQRNAPPPRFEYSDIVPGEGRRKSRPRTWQTSAVGAAVLITIVAGMASIQMLGDNRPDSTLAAPERPPAAAAAPDSRPPRVFAETAAPAPPAEPVPGAPPAAGAQPAPGTQPVPGVRSAPDARSATPFDGPPGAQKRVANSSCARPDAQLFTALVEAIPAVRRQMPRPLADAVRCPEGGRGVEVDVVDRGAHGILRVFLVPPEWGGMDTSGQGVGSTLTTSAATRGGARLVVSMTAPAGHRVPYVSQLDTLANRLAKRF